MKTSAGESLHIAPHLFPLLNEMCANSEGSDSPTREIDSDERPLGCESTAKDGEHFQYVSCLHLRIDTPLLC